MPLVFVPDVCKIGCKKHLFEFEFESHNQTKTVIFTRDDGQGLMQYICNYRGVDIQRSLNQTKMFFHENALKNTGYKKAVLWFRIFAWW